MAGVSEFFTMNPNLKYFVCVCGGGGGGGARVSEFFLQRIQIYEKKFFSFFWGGEG